MKIKEHRLLQFMELYKELSGETLSREDAFEKASLLLQYGLMCIKPLAKLDEHDTMTLSDNEHSE